ncbi:MAG: pyridoxamine 5-phosphate oxidase-related FMN-binding [Acidimicrobiales bacterium]|nr:pyridoxamine 5-phosphate oxidase-related FMN-binding [Acidimicrobiales bacterium]
MLDPKIRDFAQAKNYGTISVHLPDGSIATHVMWVHADDEHVLINTEVHRAKYKAIAANPKVTVVVWDNANPDAYAEVRGTVTGDVRGPAALDSINELSQKYAGTQYAGEIQSERVILQITPDRQRSQGF